MVLKIFRTVWFLSVLAVFASLLYQYAKWQEILVIQEGGGQQISVGRDALFYVMVAVIALVNVQVYLIGKMFPAEESFRAWFHGLIITFNTFFILAISLVGVYNSTERFDFSRIGFMVYGSVALIVLWALSWPLLRIYQKFFIKQTI